MNTCEQAETLRLLLIMGVAPKAEIIAWADDRIMSEKHPPEWLLDLSLAANEKDYVIEEILRHAPCEGDRTAAAFSALDRFAEAFRSGGIPAQQAAQILYGWAASANLNDQDRTQGMVPLWVADEVQYGYTSDQSVVESINQSLAHFAAVRRVE